MKVLKKENLKKYTTIRIGGIAENFYMPENRDELVVLLTELADKEVYILGGGSNVLIDDESIFQHVIYMGNCDNRLEHMGEGLFCCGASVRLQRLIQYTNECGYGGIEYLMSVPGMVGGAVTMNAGRGKKHNQTISDYIVEVEVWKDGRIQKLSRSECQFSHRNSMFKNNNIIILSVLFRFFSENKQVLKEKRKARIEYSKNCQDHSAHNFGSVFCDCNPMAMRLIKRFHLCKKGDVTFSKKTSNWILNKGAGTYSQVDAVIRTAERINRIFGTKAEKEVIIWKSKDKMNVQAGK